MPLRPGTRAPGIVLRSAMPITTKVSQTRRHREPGPLRRNEQQQPPAETMIASCAFRFGTIHQFTHLAECALAHAGDDAALAFLNVTHDCPRFPQMISAAPVRHPTPSKRDPDIPSYRSPVWIVLEEILAARPPSVDDAHLFHHAQVLGHCLASRVSFRPSVRRWSIAARCRVWRATTVWSHRPGRRRPPPFPIAWLCILRHRLQCS